MQLMRQPWRPSARSLAAVGFVCLLGGVVPCAQAPPALTLEAAFARALEANPTIAAARLRRPIDLAGIDVAREHLNPEVHVEFERETPKEAYGIAVPLELGGKRAKRIAVGEATMRTGDAELAQTTIEVRNAVRRAYFDACDRRRPA